ncbi:hypothetical protein GCM10010329_15800 [Streptomyces spiroverticillatus]|uniref:Uncharacterized protein n=1 Tax=Streptomyces finlayi TaxID=67296 RepID=A0A918X321_9ACTN|nr:hypothetical protein GCM10010329_15800 [Streptomyces spiroverticillatus]GHD07361.1 hypothetical protein GCM10010334_59830 [Streptomyces finlayi]
MGGGAAPRGRDGRARGRPVRSGPTRTPAPARTFRAGCAQPPGPRGASRHRAREAPARWAKEAPAPPLHLKRSAARLGGGLGAQFPAPLKGARQERARAAEPHSDTAPRP